MAPATQIVPDLGSHAQIGTYGVNVSEVLPVSIAIFLTPNSSWHTLTVRIIDDGVSLLTKKMPYLSLWFQIVTKGMPADSQAMQAACTSWKIARIPARSAHGPPGNIVLRAWTRPSIRVLLSVKHALPAALHAI